MARETVGHMVAEMGLTWADWQAMSRQERMSRTLAHTKGEAFDGTLMPVPTLPNGLKMVGWT